MNIIHIRTSTMEQEPQNQLKGCLSIYKEEWGEYKVYEEKQSAFKDNVNREVFEEIRKLIKRRKVKHYIVWDIDRIYRNRKRLIAFFQLCKLHDCKIHSYRQQFFETLNTMPEPFNEAMFDFMLQIMGWIAEDDSKKKSDRVKSAVRRKDGITKSYKGNKWGRKQLSTFKKNQIELLRKRGGSIREIARDLNISIGVVHKYITSKKGEKG